MPKKWTEKEQGKKLRELEKYYVRGGLPIRRVANILHIAEQTVFKRLQYFSIPSNPKFKRRQDVRLPQIRTVDLAEFFGVMLGDGHLTHFQISVTLGTKELAYAEYIVDLIKSIFKVKPKIAFRKTGCKDVYLGSVEITGWLMKEGLVYNKGRSQVDIPRWIFRKKEFMRRCIRGLFDTDGSVYKLRWGVQISFTNKSMPMLRSFRKMLRSLGYQPSKITCFTIYVTRKKDVIRFFREIQPKNPKHVACYRQFSSYYRAGS